LAWRSYVLLSLSDEFKVKATCVTAFGAINRAVV